MKELTCIVCPVGCSLAVDDDTLAISGNLCARGAVYAKEEITSPRRVVTATCAANIESSPGGKHEPLRRIPVKTSVPCPREKIKALLADIYRTSAELPVSTGDVIIADWEGSGIDVVATRSIS